MSIIDKIKTLGVPSIIQKLRDGNQFTIEQPQPDYSKLVHAIGMNETSVIPEDKRYIYSRNSGKKELGRALGKYQVTEGELKTYAPQYLGRPINSKEFLSNPQLQDQYMTAKVKRFKEEMNASDDDVLAMHFGGMNYDKNRKSVQEYVTRGKQFLQ